MSMEQKMRIGICNVSDSAAVIPQLVAGAKFIGVSPFGRASEVNVLEMHGSFCVYIIHKTRLHRLTSRTRKRTDPGWLRHKGVKRESTSHVMTDFSR